MVQIYLLSEVYLILAAAILLSDRYGADFLFLFNLKSAFESNYKLRVLGVVWGLVLVVLLCFVPMSPGPAFIGDLLPCICIIFVLAKLFLHKTGTGTGVFCLVCAIIHMIFPSLVLL